ncbi:MAG: penicillin-binding protein [Calditrichia bacterium]
MLVILAVLFAFAFLGIAARLVQLQVLKHSYYLKKSKKNVESRQEIAARRGTIFDRNGRVLARDVLQYKVVISKNSAANLRKVVKAVSETLKIPSQTIWEKIKANPSYAVIKQRVTADQAAPLQKISDPGLRLERKFLRIYPYKDYAASVIGFCDIDNNALGGVELQYDKYLKGRAGWHSYVRNAAGELIPDLDVAGQEPLDGMDVVLTLDMDFQRVLEEELKTVVKQHEAESAVAVLQDPNTAAILGMASYPGFDPNQFDKYKTENLKNLAISDPIEPGSTFKIIPLAAALEQLQVDLDAETVNCENGRFKLHRQWVYDHKKYGVLTLREAFEHSSNIGMMKLTGRLDKRKFYNYIRNFGFGMVTGVDLPGESNGILHPLESFSAVSPYFLSIGYEVSVTPLQLSNAYAALANGGELYQPYLLKEVRDLSGEVVEKGEPRLIRKVIATQTARIINEALCGVVERGTGVKAAVDGLEIAGKTGTAQLYNAKTGKHDNNRHLASFVGFFPYQNPQFVLLVMVKNPRGVYYGGLVAAPAFHAMAERISSLAAVKINSVPRMADLEPEKDKEVPNVSRMPLSLAKKILKQRDLEVTVMGSGKWVTRQTVSEDNKSVTLITNNNLPENDWVMPSLQGLSVKESLDILSVYEVRTAVEGSGVVIRQHPKPGSKLRGIETVKLVCKPS